MVQPYRPKYLTILMACDDFVKALPARVMQDPAHSERYAKLVALVKSAAVPTEAKVRSNQTCREKRESEHFHVAALGEGAEVVVGMTALMARLHLKENAIRVKFSIGRGRFAHHYNNEYLEVIRPKQYQGPSTPYAPDQRYPTPVPRIAEPLEHRQRGRLRPAKAG